MMYKVEFMYGVLEGRVIQGSISGFESNGGKGYGDGIRQKDTRYVT